MADIITTQTIIMLLFLNSLFNVKLAHIPLFTPDAAEDIDEAAEDIVILCKYKKKN